MALYRSIEAELSELHGAGVGLDVLSTEPPVADDPLLNALRCFITPHQSWATRAARARLIDIAVENIRAFQVGSRAEQGYRPHA